MSLRADLDSLCDEPEVILDMSAVTYLDSTFVNELLRLHMVRTERNLRPLSIVRGSLVLKRLFALFSLGALFRLVDTLQEALSKDGMESRIRATTAHSLPFVVRHAHPGDNAEIPDIAIYSTKSGLPAPVWNSLGGARRWTVVHSQKVPERTLLANHC